MTTEQGLTDTLRKLAEILPARVGAPSDRQVISGWYVNPCGTGANWTRLSFTSGADKTGWTEPTFEALGVLGVALEQELNARNWDWHTHNTGPREHRRYCAQVYPSESALSGMFQAYAETPTVALARALLSALESQK